MATNRDPILKRCRSLDIDPGHLGIFKESKRQPRRNMRKMSEYGLQLREKQKVKRIYGVLEKQFRHYFDVAEKQQGITGENLLALLETRLDNAVYRMGMGQSRKEARQLVLHGHFLVNGAKVNVASYQLKAGDVISVADKSKKSAKFKEVVESTENRAIVPWLEADLEKLSGKVIGKPSREDIDIEIAEHLIVELYSK